jgi:hypothetical protein
MCNPPVAGYEGMCNPQPRREDSLWWVRLGSNQRPLPCEGSALPLSYAPASEECPKGLLYLWVASERLNDRRKSMTPNSADNI